MLPSPVTWVDTRSLRGNVESRAGGTSLFNVAEARLVTSITRYLAAQAPPNLTIGVITAYVQRREAENYHFTSALPVTLLKLLAPTLLAKLDKNFKEPPTTDQPPAEPKANPNISSTSQPLLAVAAAH